MDFDDLLAASAGPRYTVYGKPALWNGLTCTAIREAADKELGFGHSRLVANSVILTVRVSEVATPATKDVVILNPNTPKETRFEIMGVPQRDDRGFEWHAEARPV